MPNLREVVIKKTSLSSLWEREYEWPMLQSVQVTVDSERLAEVDCPHFLIPPMTTKFLLDFFFHDIERPSVRLLFLRWTEEFTDKCAENGIAVPIPRADDIISSCSNLAVLVLVNWPGTNKALSKIWGSLRGLRDIYLSNCKGLGNSAFVGEDVGKPVFFQLRNLRKLSLMGLDKMPKVTDTLFKLVLCHMTLTHLTISSDEKLRNVTANGIRALLTGECAVPVLRMVAGGCGR